MQASSALPQTTPTPDNSANIALVGRQPIYGPDRAVAAYELLYAPITGQDGLADASETALRVLTDAALEIGLDRLAGALPVHIHYPAALLSVDNPLSVQPQRVAIQVTADGSITAAARTGLRKLKARGHPIILDRYSPPLQDVDLLGLADVVKIPLESLPQSALSKLVPLLSKRNLGVIARDVETTEQFEWAGRLGFDGFQGGFLSKPQKLSATRPPRNSATILKLVETLQSPHCTFEELEQLLQRDLSMSYKVLRCINSSYYSLPQRVDSIRQALVLLGMDNLRQLCMLAALQQLEDRSRNVLVMAMTRALMCEQLARLTGESRTAPYFITGLFSMLDVLLGMPMSRLVKLLPLSSGIEAALVSAEGSLGQALVCTRAYENACFHDANFSDVSPQLIRAAYLEAVSAAEHALSAP